MGHIKYSKYPWVCDQSGNYVTCNDTRKMQIEHLRCIRNWFSFISTDDKDGEQQGEEAATEKIR